MNVKKAQSSMELMVILVFILSIIAGIMFIVGKFSLDINNEEVKKNLDDFAYSITKEFDVLSNYEEGYSKTIIIPFHQAEKHNITFDTLQGTLALTDKDIYISGEEKYFYYDIPENVSVATSYDVDGNLIIVLTNDYRSSFDGIMLGNLGYGSSIIISSASGFTVYVVNYPNCSLNPGTTKLYGFESNTYSHAEIPSEENYNYSVCIQHNTFSLGNGCSGLSETLFFLGNITNSNIWVDNSTAYIPPIGPSYYNWQELCINATGGASAFNYIVDVVDRTATHACLGSLQRNDTYGGHIIGNFSMCTSGDSNPELWLAIS